MYNIEFYRRIGHKKQADQIAISVKGNNGRKNMENEVKTGNLGDFGLIIKMGSLFHNVNQIKFIFHY